MTVQFLKELPFTLWYSTLNAMLVLIRCCIQARTYASLDTRVYKNFMQYIMVYLLYYILNIIFYLKNCQLKVYCLVKCQERP